VHRVELQRAAAEQFLIGGHIDRGLDVIRGVLADVRLRLARSPRAALASLLWRRLRLRWRGLTFVERDARCVPPAQLLRVDTCGSVATGLALVDYARATDFQTRHLLLALDVGEPGRIARALAADVLFHASRGGRHRRMAIECAARAEAIAAVDGRPAALAFCALARGVSAFLEGDWPAAQAHSDRALNMLRGQAVATIWEVNSAQVFRLSARMYQGELREVARELPALLDAARTRGNLYLETEMRTRLHLLWLASDQPDEGERQAHEAIERWSHSGFHRQHYNYLLDRVQTELYRGHARAAWQVIDDNWKAISRTHLLRIQFQRIEAWYLRARCALLMAAIEPHARSYLKLARADARRIAREHMAWSDPLALLLKASVAYLEGRPSVARATLSGAAAGFERAHMKLYVAATHRRLGELSPDLESQHRRREANDWMLAQGIVNPSRISRLIAPGFADEPDATSVVRTTS
jgi:hypothetical protein